VRNGLVAVSTAAIHAAREPNSEFAAQNATGMASSAQTTDRARVASSDVPNALIQTCSSR
jgi:hypothetical protein